MADVVATSLFCDDVRHEVGGKASVIGVYRGFLGVPASVPFLPKLVALVMLQYPRALQGAPAHLRLMDRDTPILEADFNLAPGSPLPAEVEAAGFGDTIYAHLPIEIVGLALENGMRLVVHLEVGDYTYRGDELLIVRPRDSVESEPAAKASH